MTEATDKIITNPDAVKPSPELERAARAMFKRLPFPHNDAKWKQCDKVLQDTYRQAFAAGLLALLPVSEATELAMMRACPDELYSTSQSRKDEFTAAINNIAGQS